MSDRCDHWQAPINPCVGTCARGVFVGKRYPSVCTNCAYNTVPAAWPLLRVRGQELVTAETELLAAKSTSPDLLGDRLAAWFEKWGADKAAAAWERVTGTPCGCKGRRDFLNRVDSMVRSLLGR